MVLCIKIFKSTRLEGIKMIKLKELIKEHSWKRKFGESLPTLETSTQKHKAKKVNEGGMGILSSDQADILQGIVLRNKNKNLKGILNVALKSGHFKNVDKKELLGYIDGAKQFVKYMKSHPMESVISERNPDAELYKKLGKIGTDIGSIVKKYEKMADTNKALSTFMVGLHGMLNKMGYKEFK